MQFPVSIYVKECCELFQVMDISLDNNILFIKFSSDKILSNLKAEFRLKDTARYSVNAYNQFFEVDVHCTEKVHEIKLDVSLFADLFYLDNVNKHAVWIYINNNEEFQQLMIDNQIIDKLNSINSMDFCSLAKLRLSKHNNNTALGLTIEKINVNCYLNKINLLNNRLILELFPIQIPDKNVLPSRVQLKRRVYKDTLIYSQSISLTNTNENIFELCLAELNNLEFDTVTNMDFIAEVWDRNVSIELPVFTKITVDLMKIDFNSNYNSKLYFTPKNSLSLRVETKYPALEVLELNADEHLINLEINLASIQGMTLKCGLYRTNKLINDNELILYKTLPISIHNSICYLTLNTADLFSENKSNHIQEYTILLFDESTNPGTFFQLTSSKNFMHSNISTCSKINLSIDKKALIEVDPLSLAPIKIGVLGTCFSRAAFNSSNGFFNPDYKLYYSLEYSHFWISVISAVSEKIPFNADHYSGLPEQVIENIRKEYDKPTFDELSKANADYVIIDFFVDAVHGVRKFSDGKFIGQNGDMYSTHFYKNCLLKETSQFDFRHPDFWNTWKDSCNKFIKLLEQIVPLNNIILTIGGFSDSYFNENEEISNFSKDKKFGKTQINFINHTWEKMNNYFISKVPAAKVLELRQYGYKASLDYPFGQTGPHHYERNYYKSFIGELSKIILFDRLNKTAIPDQDQA